MNNFTKFIISILIPVVGGLLTGWLTPTGNSAWFQTINKPSWNPPSWVFGPVWTTLYLLMGIALFLIWKHPASPKEKRNAYLLFGIQLLLNFAWSFIFFSMHELGWALVEIIVLWFFILLTIVSFSRFNKTAAWLLLPYLCWVTFASLLTWTIWSINPSS